MYRHCLYCCPLSSGSRWKLGGLGLHDGVASFGLRGVRGLGVLVGLQVIRLIFLGVRKVGLEGILHLLQDADGIASLRDVARLRLHGDVKQVGVGACTKLSMAWRCVGVMISPKSSL